MESGSRGHLLYNVLDLFVVYSFIPFFLLYVMHVKSNTIYGGWYKFLFCLEAPLMISSPRFHVLVLILYINKTKCEEKLLEVVR